MQLLDWSAACAKLSQLILSCNEQTSAIFEKRLHTYIQNLQPDVLITAYLEGKLQSIDNQEEKAFKVDFYTAALLALDEDERLTVFKKCLYDLRNIFPKDVQELEVWLDDTPEASETDVQKSRRAEKLNRYLKRIDGAIYARRYTLALKLANRCLKEYYQDFLNYKMPESKSLGNINQMSWSIYRYIVRYFRRYNIPYPSHRLIFMTMVTNAIFMTMNNLIDENTYVDRAFAMYARDNVNSIVRFLLKYF